MSLKNPTIYDIAKNAGVSPATVSRVLNDPSKVAEEKRNKILSVIKEMNFVPKAEAVAVAKKFYKKICVIAPFFTQLSFMERLRGVESVLNEEHFEIVIYSISSMEDLSEYIKVLTTLNKTDGLIIFSLRPDEEALKLLKEAKFPVCFIESDTTDFDCVGIRNFFGGEKAAEYFFNKGCRKPAFIGEKAVFEHTVPVTEERFKGYKSFFESKNVNIAENHIWIGEFTEKKLDEGINQFLEQKDLPDCVFCSSDLIAIRFVTLANEKGIQIPKDIKVLGFDDIDIAKYVGLSSVSQSLDESGVLAAKMILNRLQDSERQPYTTLAPIKVIERETSL